MSAGVDYDVVSAKIRELLQANLEAWPDDADTVTALRHSAYNKGLHDLWEHLRDVEYPRQESA